MERIKHISQAQHEQLLTELKEFYEVSINIDDPSQLSHISNTLTRRSYIDKCSEVLVNAPRDANFLDWGAGFGQISYILSKLGREVVSYEVFPRKCSMLSLLGQESVIGIDDVALPFESDSFDVVIGCGVLEHVPNISGSLKELHRIIKPGGYLFIYNLPYILSPSEAYATYKGISVHPIKFTKQGVKQLLHEANFNVEFMGYENGIPKRLTGPLKHFRFIGDRFPSFLAFLDKIIVNTPIVKSLFSNSIKIRAKK